MVSSIQSSPVLHLQQLCILHVNAASLTKMTAATATASSARSDSPMAESCFPAMGSTKAMSNSSRLA